MRKTVFIDDKSADVLRHIAVVEGVSFSEKLTQILEQSAKEYAARVPKVDLMGIIRRPDETVSTSLPEPEPEQEVEQEPETREVAPSENEDIFS